MEDCRVKTFDKIVERERIINLYNSLAYLVLTQSVTALAGQSSIPISRLAESISNIRMIGERRVQKLSMKPIERVIQIGYLNFSDSNSQSGRVYAKEGISPTLDCCDGGNRQPKIVVVYEKD